MNRLAPTLGQLGSIRSTTKGATYAVLRQRPAGLGSRTRIAAWGPDTGTFTATFTGTFTDATDNGGTVIDSATPGVKWVRDGVYNLAHAPMPLSWFERGSMQALLKPHQDAAAAITHICETVTPPAPGYTPRAEVPLPTDFDAEDDSTPADYTPSYDTTGVTYHRVTGGYLRMDKTSDLTRSAIMSDATPRDNMHILAKMRFGTSGTKHGRGLGFRMSGGPGTETVMVFSLGSDGAWRRRYYDGGSWSGEISVGGSGSEDTWYYMEVLVKDGVDHYQVWPVADGLGGRPEGWRFTETSPISTPGGWGLFSLGTGTIDCEALTPDFQGTPDRVYLEADIPLAVSCLEVPAGTPTLSLDGPVTLAQNSACAVRIHQDLSSATDVVLGGEVTIPDGRIYGVDGDPSTCSLTIDGAPQDLVRFFYVDIATGIAGGIDAAQPGDTVWIAGGGPWDTDVYPILWFRYRITPGVPMYLRLLTWESLGGAWNGVDAAKAQASTVTAPTSLIDDGDWHEIAIDTAAVMDGNWPTASRHLRGLRFLREGSPPGGTEHFALTGLEIRET